jgi:hypothetical protein
MKKTLSLIILMLVTMACTISPSTLSFDQNVAAGVAVAFTETALQATVGSQQLTATPENEITQTPTATQTPPADDPKNVLGDPSWQDSLSNGKNWQLDSGDVIFGDSTFSQSSGMLTAVNAIAGDGMIWYLSYLSFQNAYLEAKFEVEDCSAGDQYGLVVRAKDYEDGLAYYYVVNCGGQYDLRRWNASGSELMLGLPSSDAINSGSNQTNTLGIWINGSVIRLYMNNQFLKEINDSSISVDGHFGLFINAAQTSGFTLHMDEIAYWLLD